MTNNNSSTKKKLMTFSVRLSLNRMIQGMLRIETNCNLPNSKKSNDSALTST